MGGFSYQDMAAWDKQGRKRTGTENLNEILKGQQANRQTGMEDQLMQAKMMDSGFTQQPQQGGGMGGLLSKLMGGGQDYQFTGKPEDARQSRQDARQSQQDDRKLYDQISKQVLLRYGANDFVALEPALREQVQREIAEMFQRVRGGNFGYSGPQRSAGGNNDPAGIR